MVVREKFARFGKASARSLSALARKGVEAEVFYSFADVAHLTDTKLGKLISMHPRTVRNYSDNKKALEPIVSEHLLKLISLYGKGEEILGSVEEFNYWLNKPAPRSKEKPIDLLITPGGVDLVAEELEKMAQGYPL